MLPLLSNHATAPEPIRHCDHPLADRTRLPGALSAGLAVPPREELGTSQGVPRIARPSRTATHAVALGAGIPQRAIAQHREDHDASALLAQLEAIIALRTGGKADPSALHRRIADGWSIDCPTDALAFAVTYCRAAVPHLPTGSPCIATAGADHLVRFLADLPPTLRDAVTDVPSFTPPPARAWLEPHQDAYIGLCNTVHDVWSHLCGHETGNDHAILAHLLGLGARTVFDYGAGAGHFAHALAAHGLTVEAVEADPVKMAFFEYRAAQSGLADRMCLAKTRDSYDLVLALNVLDHLEVPREAVAHLSDLVAPRGILCTLAAFPDDGWHQSDPVLVDQCAQDLWERFCPVTEPPVPWFECFARRSALGSLPAAHMLRPRLHPSAFFTADELDGVVLHAPQFYALPCRLNDAAAQLCTRFDGLRTLTDLCSTENLVLDDVYELCDRLTQQRLLTWSTGDVASARTLKAIQR